MLTLEQTILLKADIESRPELEGFVRDLFDQQIADYYNTPQEKLTKSVPQIPIAKVLIWAGTGPFAKIVDASEDKTSPVRSAALSALRLFGTVENVDLSLPNVKGMVDAFLAVGVLTQEEHDSFLTLQTSPATPAEHLFNTERIHIDNGDISQALRGYR